MVLADTASLTDFGTMLEPVKAAFLLSLDQRIVENYNLRAGLGSLAWNQSADNVSM